MATTTGVPSKGVAHTGRELWRVDAARTTTGIGNASDEDEDDEANADISDGVGGELGS